MASGIGTRGALSLGTVPERAATKHGNVPLRLDHELTLLPGRAELTVAELSELVATTAARLWAAGVYPGERVAIHTPSGFDVYVLATAVARIGAVPAMLSPALDGQSVRALLRKLGCPRMLTDAGTLDDRLADVVSTGFATGVIVAGRAHPEANSLGEFRPRQRVKPVQRHPDEAALITHTSGTTGLPKLVVHSARSLHGRFVPQRRLARFVSNRDTAAVRMSVVHSRMFLAMAVLLPKGMPLVVMEHDDPETAARMFAADKPGFIETHPDTFARWAELADDPRRPLSNVKYFSSTFDAIHPGTVSRLLAASERRSPRLFQIYGQSENGPMVGRGYSRKRAHEVDGRCMGYTMPGVTKARVVPRDGVPPSKDSPGFVEVRTRGRAVGYLGDQERFARNVTDDGWWRTGDVGYRGRLGCLHLLDREVDVVPSISSTLEVEDVILANYDELREVVVVRGPRSEPVPVVCTPDDAPLDIARWRRAVADLPPLADPVPIPCTELPRTATQKVKRLELARRIGDSERYVS